MTGGGVFYGRRASNFNQLVENQTAPSAGTAAPGKATRKASSSSVVIDDYAAFGLRLNTAQVRTMPIKLLVKSSRTIL